MAACKAVPQVTGLVPLGQLTSQAWQDPSSRQICPLGHWLLLVQATQVWAAPQIGVVGVPAQAALAQQVPLTQPPPQQTCPLPQLVPSGSALPATQTPPWQTSLWVQGLPAPPQAVPLATGAQTPSAPQV